MTPYYSPEAFLFDLALAEGEEVSGPCRSLTVDELAKTFERVCCINLDRRPDRWTDFLARLPADWPFEIVQRYSAIDGKQCAPPRWWKAGRGAWGCMRSHLRILEDCLNQGVRSVLILEDDAMFCENFVPKVHAFLEHTPADWQLIYLGGQHLKITQTPPRKLNNWAYQPFNVNRSHAVGIQGDMLEIVYQHLNDTKRWNSKHHVDHHMGRLHERRMHRIYTPKEWLVGQAAGQSNILGRVTPERFWLTSEQAVEKANRKFVAVTGSEGDVSGCIALALRKLGVHMGRKVPEGKLGRAGEAEGLARICESAVRFSSRRAAQPAMEHRKMLASWINARQREAHEQGTIAGGRHPYLGGLLDHLQLACGRGLRVIHVTEVQSSSESELAGKQSPMMTAKAAARARIDRWVAARTRALLPRLNHLTVNPQDFLANPRRGMDQIIQFLEINPPVAQMQDALALASSLLSSKDQTHIDSIR